MRAYRPRHASCGHPRSRILTIFHRATEKATCPPVPQGFGGLFYFAVASVAAALKARRLAEKRPTANHPTRPQKRAIINNPGAKREVAETIARRTVSKIPKPTAHIIARRKERANMPESSPPTPPKPRDMPKNIAKPFISFLLSSVSAQILPQAQPHRALQRSSQSHRSRQKRSTQTHPKNTPTTPAPALRKAPHIAPTTIPMIRFRMALLQVVTTALPIPAEIMAVSGERRNRTIHECESRFDASVRFSS